MSEEDIQTPMAPSVVASGPLKNFLAGGFGGMCLVFAGHPFDTIKVRLQTMAKTSSPGGYSGALDCFRKTFVNEGITGFYKGMGTPLFMTTPLFALAFFGYGTGKTIVGKVASVTDPGKMTPLQLFCAGAISGTITSFVVAPVERIKCLLQIQIQQATTVTTAGKGPVAGAATVLYKGPLHCGTVLLKQGGVPNLYKGFGATFMRGIPQSGLYFATYDVLKRNMTNEQGVLTTGMTLLAGGMTGVINWTLVLPLDVIKSRVQTASEGQYPRGVRDALPQLLRTEGPRGLFRGIVPVFMRAFPANAACFMGFETAMKFLNWTELF